MPRPYLLSQATKAELVQFCTEALLTVTEGHPNPKAEAHYQKDLNRLTLPTLYHLAILLDET